MTGARRVLIVEDDPDSAEVLADFLRLAGFDPALARTVDQALARARAESPAWIVCDIELAGERSGYDLAREVREDPGLARIDMVATTGHAARNLSERVLAAGFDHVLYKPYDLDRLRELLD